MLEEQRLKSKSWTPVYPLTHVVLIQHIKLSHHGYLQFVLNHFLSKNVKMRENKKVPRSIFLKQVSEALVHFRSSLTQRKR